MPRATCAALVAALLGWAALPAVEPPPAIRFSEVGERAGIALQTTNGDPARKYILETLGSGAALLDHDGDGDLDLYLANGAMLEPTPAGQEPTGALYRNDGGGRFTDVSRQAGVALAFWGLGAAAGDYDNDGDADLLVTAYGPDHLFRNNSDGTFTDVSREAGVDDPRLGASAAFLDYDLDGALDLFVANYLTFDPAVIPPKGDPNSPCRFRGLLVMCGPQGLPGAVDALYHNNGDGTFTDVSESAGLYMGGTYYGLGVVTADFDGDARQEILVANDSTPNHHYRNEAGRFVDEGMLSGFAYSADGREQAGMGIDSGDVDADGDLDVFVTNFSHDYSTLRLNDGSGAFEDVSVRLGLGEMTIRTLGWGTLLLDLDNDGDLDIFIANGHVYPEVDQADIGTTYRQPCQVIENQGALRFREVIPSASEALAHLDLHRGLAAGDVDADGDLDLIVTVLTGRPRLLLNEAPAASWLDVRLIGRRSNRDGVGARVTLRAAGRQWVAERSGGRSYLSSSTPLLHFGLGSASQLDEIEVQWPSGTRQTIRRPPLRTILTILEEVEAPAGAASGKPASGKREPS